MSVTARHMNVAAMLREGQLEAAQGELSKMEAEGLTIHGWLFVLLLQALCQGKDFDAVLGLIYSLHDKHVELPSATWLHVLEEAALAQHLDVTDWIWQKHVESMSIMPHADCCIRTLKLAVNEGHLKLADSVMSVLESIAPDTVPDYRHMVDSAYKQAGKVRVHSVRPKGMHSLFKKQRADTAFFDPKVALAKRPLQRFLNPRRWQRKSDHEKVSRR